MRLSSISIQRPVLSIVMSIAIILFGIIGYTYLGIREFPAVDPPVITVNAAYPGANADVIESKITEILEESINGIAGITSLTSISRDGASTITVEFSLDSDLETAANDVRDRVARVQRQLPADMDPPAVSKADANSDAILVVTVQSEQRNLLEISDIAANTIKKQLQTIPGVSEIRIWGERKYAMRLWMDPAKLSAYGLTPLDIKTVLDRENVELPSGSVEGNTTEVTVRTLGRFSTEEEFNNLIIRSINGNMIRFSDIGKATLEAENIKTILRTDGKPMFGVAITPQPGSNHIAIAKEFYKRVESIKKELPEDLKLKVILDTTISIKDSLKEVIETLAIAFVLVVLILFLFLRDWRTTIIPVIAIPISLIGTFFLMYMLNYSINVLTLLGVVLATGLVVDDAIVVLENIFAKTEQGLDPIAAAHEGSKEIFFAVLSTTITLAAVFLPIIFLQGLTGRLFREFGIVIAGSVLISAFVSLTLTPMMSSRFIKTNQSHGEIYQFIERILHRLLLAYRNSLQSFIRNPIPSFIVTIISFGMIWVFGKTLSSEIAPLQDRSRMRVSATAHEGATFEFMDGYISSISTILRDSVPEIQSLLTVTSPSFGTSSTNTAFIRLFLSDPEQRKRTQMQIGDYVTQLVKELPQAKGLVIQEQTISTGGAGIGGLPVQFVIQATDIERLRSILPSFLDEASKNPVFAVVDVNLKFTKPELRLSIDRNKARSLGINTADISQTLQFALAGQRYGYFVKDGRQYQVIGQAQRLDRNDVTDIKSMYVRSSGNMLIQLDNVVNFVESSAPPSVYHYNRAVSATVSAGVAPGYTIGDGINAMREIADQVLDPSYSTALTGTSKDFEESSSSLLFAFLLALVLIYLVLAAQFESFLDPLIILLCVPMALAGALFTLWYFNQTLNIFSQIGIIMLIGLVTKNAILIIEFAHQREKELSAIDAVIDAATSRFRPILMTSLATILGVLPIALAIGGGSESRISMGIAVVGGLLFSLVLTLYTIPGFFVIASRLGTTKSP
ncbi:MAG: efflux RND transporter permease subunit [Bacteroidetes bacterium]|nr:efflux RND transporter permease subunit [bacterium]NBP63226.1 efflux RND transporter permease subunit [Bacteroidota bacterium]